MKCLLDSGFLYALADADDSWHSKALQAARTYSQATFFLPVPVLPEALYLIGSRLGHSAMRYFLNELLVWDIQLESIDKIDLERIALILEQYADTHLDFVDAAIVAIAERLGVSHILTVDRRDFSIIRPRHCEFFELLP